GGRSPQRSLLAGRSPDVIECRSGQDSEPLERAWEQATMASRILRTPDRVYCAVCGRIVQASEARMVDICGPVYFCPRCPDVSTMWPTGNETAECSEQRRIRESMGRGAVAC